MNLVIISTTFSGTVYALDLPPDLIAQLHTDLKVAILFDTSHGWWTESEHPIPFKYYKITEIDVNGLYGLASYDVLIAYSGGKDPVLTEEQIELIVKFVEGGGGLILGYNGYNYYDESCRKWSPTLSVLLRKFGIFIKAFSNIKSTIILEKDGKQMLEHPITTDVDMLEAIYACPLMAVESGDADVFITAPFIVVAKEFGAGRVVFYGHGGSIKETLGGLRLGVNTIEWVAGFSSPGWSPPEIKKQVITVTVTGKEVTQTTTITQGITITRMVGAATTMTETKTVTKGITETVTETITGGVSEIGTIMIATAIIALAIVVGLVAIVIIMLKKRQS
ncbi:MAG: hypothetical protein QXO15_11175 [Nitrososphaerota archaeon]